MSITDILLLGPEELRVLRCKYPACEITNLSNTSHKVQQYQLDIATDDEESYFDFLLDNFLPLSSTSFLSKLKEDKKFAERMTMRITG